MTDQEFATFAKRLFVAFPSLWNWLQSSSPDPIETQAIWRNTLRPYTIDECIWVVEAWSSDRFKFPEAWERDKIHLSIKQIIEKKRSDESKKLKQEDEWGSYKKDKRGAFDITQRFDKGMRDAYEELRPIWGQHVDGTISRQQFDQAKHDVLSKM